MKLYMHFTLFIVFAALPVAADTLVVTNTTSITRISTADYDGITADTPHQMEYPSDVGDPIFWLDCANTNGWTFNASGRATKVPSRTGDRYLSLEAGNVHGITGVSTGSWQAPAFIDKDPDLGGPALDFGTKGTYRVLLFNPVGPEGATTNMLDGIGSLFAVYYSAKGPGANGEGGYYGGGILGGGFGGDGVVGGKDGFVLYRGTSDTRRTSSENSGDTGRSRFFENPIANSSHTHNAIRLGLLRHDGQVTQPIEVGFTGGWEVFSLSPNATYGLFNATGFGMNDARIGAIFGGFKVAEYLIYDRKLSDDEAVRVEDYLRNKWFPSRRARGRNGDSRIAWLRVSRNNAGAIPGVEMPVDVPAGEKLTIGRLTGGYGTTEAAIVKSGAGTLEIQDAANYSGAVKMNGGTLAFSRRPVPATLPRDMVLHFDASTADSVVTNESGKVMVWRNLTDEVFRRETICGARPAADVNAPTLLTDELGEGMNVLDFGDLSTSGSAGQFLYLSTNATEETVKTDVVVQSPVTMIAVVGAQRGGGQAIIGATGWTGSPFDRYSGVPGHFTQRLIGDYSLRNSVTAAKNDTAFVDGIEVDCTADKKGYLTPGYQVVAIRTPGSPNICKIGSGDRASGGFRLAEVAVWRRVLTDDEIRDASATLMKKWLNREAPGYARFKTDGIADLQKVTAVADTVIDVPEGTARIGTLASTGGRIVKTGAGTLEVQKIDAETVIVEGGHVVQVAKPDACADHKLDDDSWLAAAPSLHLDAADQSSMMIREVNGERRIVAWHSDDKGVLATSPYGSGTSLYDYSQDVYTAYLNSEVTLAGHETVDFGPFSDTAGGRHMALSRSFDSIRHAYLVWTPRDDSRGVLLGCGNLIIDGNNSNLYNFLRGEAEQTALIYANDTANVVRNGKIYTNGVAVSSSMIPQAGVFSLMEFHPVGTAHASMLGIDRDVWRLSGGFRVAEIVLYERELTEREKLATRNYLMKKWFDREPEALPESEPVTSQLFNIEVDGETGLQVDAGIEAIRVTGAGTLTKSGTGTLAVGDLSAFDGTVSVAEGTVALSGQRPANVGGLVTDGLVFQADATRGLTTTTNANGIVSVDKWESALGDGWAAEPMDAANPPTLISDYSLGGHQAINFKRGDNTTGQSMLFSYNGEARLIDDMHTVFWVIGSQEGGCTALGGGTNWESNANSFNFMRERKGHTSAYFHYDDPIINGNQYWTVPATIRQADWRLDGTNIAVYTTGLSGEWDLLSMTIADNKHAANASGFAIVGFSAGYDKWRGGQRLAEVLVYNRALDDEERESVENYLRTKWGVYGYQALPTNSASVAVASGATLDLGGKEQYVAAISGAGTVQNGMLAVGTLLADPTLTDRPTVDGTLVLEDGVVVRIENAGEISASTPIPILSATAVTGLAETRRTLVFDGDTSWAGAYSARLAFEDGTLFLKFKPRGYMLFIR